MKEDDVRLTIYTPTYNREKLLPRVYRTLCRQTKKDFIWMVIDDGSSDKTADLVEKWKHQNADFKILYFYKENGGVHTARDAAYQLCTTELIMSVDSDDWLLDHAVEVILRIWEQKRSESYNGILSYIQYENGRLLSKKFPDLYAASLQDVEYKYRCSGEKYTVLRTDIIKMIPEAPKFQGENVVSENFKWIQLPDIPFIILKEPVIVKEFQKDGYTIDAYSYFLRNPNGFRVTYKQYILSGKYRRLRLKGYLGYIAASIFLKDKNAVMEAPDPYLFILLFPLGMAAYLFLLLRSKKRYAF